MLALVVTWIHVIAAMLWVGGTLFFSLVFIPSLKSGLTDASRVDLMSRVGKRFRWVGWISLAVLLATGLFRLYQDGRPLSAYGLVFSTKLVLVFVMVSLTLLHDLILGPKAILLSRSGHRNGTFQMMVRWVARVNLVMGLLIVLTAVSFVRGY